MPQLDLSSFALKITLLRTKKYHYSKALFEDDDFPFFSGWDMFSFPSVILNLGWYVVHKLEAFPFIDSSFTQKFW